MNILKTGLTATLVVAGIFAKAQTADEIVNKHIAAIGGKQVINSIKSIVTDADLSVMGSTLTSKTTVVVGKGFRNDADYNGQIITQVVTPTGGWMLNPLAGQTSPEAMSEEQVKASQSAFDVGGDLFDYQGKGSKIELAGTEKIGDVNAIKIKLTNKEGKETLFFLDPATHYILQRETTANINGQDVTSTAIFSNYKKTSSGYVIPYTTVTSQGFEITVEITKVEFNKEIDPAIFKMPE